MGLKTQCSTAAMAYCRGHEFDAPSFDLEPCTLYETRLPIADTKIAESFYREEIGLPMAHRDTTRDIVSL